MTDAQTLCRDIAKLEGWKGIHRYKDGFLGHRPGNMERGLRGFSHVPAYLTDPAETVRMLKTLIEDGGVEFDKNDNGDCFITRHPYAEGELDGLKRTFGEQTCFDTLEVATAEAYKAMLLAKKGEKV